VRELWKTVSHLLVPQTAPHDNFSAQQFSDGGQLHADFISVFPDTAALLFALFFGKLVPNPSSVTNLKLLASMVAKISRGSQIFGMLP